MFMFGAVNVTRDRESDSGQDWSRLSFPILSQEKGARSIGCMIVGDPSSAAKILGFQHHVVRPLLVELLSRITGEMPSVTNPAKFHGNSGSRGARATARRRSPWLLSIDRAEVRPRGHRRSENLLAWIGDLWPDPPVRA
ncbi:hypothetical protein Swit_2040 [Rhizorhabdus wittichii RW1]|uniref:Uncharacterized protein n=1 Tax=Rhizorhabdus wittichii (strain DSM 6014 / CCUG 31198 / JCM 15750 / NBRC 105917 / EY 4224 / RW1) TaxID=392499 RepID=A0A9J9HBM2_RHIWR|nr:hypothetical protein Swit_2040 [Rhizorhabdus wittichii RW1]